MCSKMNRKYLKLAVVFFTLGLISLINTQTTYADIYHIYRDAGLPLDTVLWTWWDGSGSVTTVYNQEAPENTAYFKTVSTNTYAGWGVFFDNGGQAYTTDLSAYKNGYLKFFIKTSADMTLKVEIELQNEEKKTVYVYTDDNKGWYEISIPITSFTSDTTKLSKIYSPFLITALGTGTFYVDYVRWVMPISGYTPTDVEVNGKQLLLNGQPFTVKGVAGDFTPVGRDGPSYDWTLYPSNYQVDLPLIQKTGANVIRVYDFPTQKQTLDELYNKGIYIIVGFPINTRYTSSQYVDFSNATVRANIKARFLEVVDHWKNHPAVLAWCLGNEVNSDVANPAAWYSLVQECAQAAHELEGANYHPVTTSNSDITPWDIGDTSINADDASLSALDFWSMNVYRGISFGTLFNDYSLLTTKPMLFNEFGCDAYNGTTGQEDQQMQFDYLKSQWNEISNNLSSKNKNNVCLGGIIFFWRDGWWKSNYGSTSTHDTSADWTNNAYTDPNMNEEWWGIVGISSSVNERTLRKGCTLWNIYVDDSTSIDSTDAQGTINNPYHTIQEAIDITHSGAVIRVAAGTYYENIILKEGANIIGNSPTDTIINGDGASTAVTAAENSQISGFTITNASYGVLCAPNFKITNCIIRSNFYGITAADSSDINIINNTIVENGFFGVFLQNPIGVHLYNNIIADNSYGIYALEYENFPKVTKPSNLPVNQSKNIKLLTDKSLSKLKNYIGYNDIVNNTSNYFGCSLDEGNISQDPLFVDASNNDYHLSGGSPCIDAGHPRSDYSNEPGPNGGRVDMGAYGNTSEATAN